MRILGFVVMMSVCGLNCLIVDKKLPTFYIWVNLYPAIDSLLRAASSRIWASEASRACYICLYREKRFLKKLDSHMGKTRN